MLKQLRQFFYRHRSVDRHTDHRHTDHRHTDHYISAEANGMRSAPTLKPELKPEFATQQFQLGHHAFNQGQFDEAIVHYRHALSADPTQTAIYQYLAEALSQVGDLVEAAACYRQAIDLTASSAAELTQLPAARLQEQQSQSQTAIGVSDRTLHPHQIRLNPKQKPDDAQPENEFANHFFHNEGNSKGAIIAHETEFYLTQAENAYRQEKWQDTVTYCHHLLQSQPNVSAYKLLGNALQRLGQFSEAVDAYLSAIQLAPQAADIYANLGSLYAQQQRWQDAVVYYQSAIAINPDFAGVYRNLAKVWVQLAQSDKAMECWYRAFRLEPEKVSAEEQINLGNWLLGQNRIEAAIDSYRHAIQIAPTLAAGYQNLAAALTRQGKTQEAAPFYCKAQELGLEISAVALSSQAAGATAIPSVSTHGKPMTDDRIAASHSFNGNGTYRSNGNSDGNGNGNGNDNGNKRHSSVPGVLTPPSRLGRAETQLATAADYFEQEQWDEAIVASAEALQQLEPELVQTYRHLADAFYAKKQLTEAIRYARRVVELEPNSAADRVNLGSFYAQQEEWQAALDCYQNAIALDANLASAYWNLAKVWEVIDRPEQATTAFFQALTLEPSWASLSEHLTLAHTLRSQSQQDFALACYQQVIQRDATCAEAYAALAEMFAQQQQWQNSVTHYQQAIQHDPKNLNYLVSFGQVLAAVQQWQAAITVYRQVIRLDPQPAHYLTLAQFLERQEQWDEAIECYQTLATLQPRWEVAHKLGDLLNRQQRWTEAVVAFRQAIELNPDYSWSHNNLGDALIHLEQWQEAAAAFRQAIELHPDFHWSHYNLGEALAKLEQWDGAIRAYRRAIELQPDLPHAPRKLADTLVQRAKYGYVEALKYFQEAVRLDPSDLDSYQILQELQSNNSLHAHLANAFEGRIQTDKTTPNNSTKAEFTSHSYESQCELFMKLERWDDAVAAYKDVIQLNPDPPLQCYCNLATALTELKQWEEAFSYYQKITKLEPNFWENQALGYRAHHSYGDVLLIHQKWKEAISAYRRAIELNPNFSWSHHGLGKALLDLEQWQEAAQSLHQAITIHPKFAWSYYHLGQALMELEMWNEAIAAYHKAVDLDPSSYLFSQSVEIALAKQQNSLNCNAQFYYDEGTHFRKIGQNDAAIRSYKSAIQLDSTFFSAYLKLADLLVVEGRLDEAIAAYEKTVALNPKEVWAYNNLGEALAHLNRIEEAIKAYQKALEVDPNFCLSYVRLGEALERQGQLDKAIDSYTVALKIDPGFSLAIECLEVASDKHRHLQKMELDYQKACEQLDSRRFGLDSFYILEAHTGDPSGLGVVAQRCSRLGKLVTDSRGVVGKVLVPGRPDLYSGLVRRENINYIWTTFESSKIPKTWVEAINTNFVEVFVPHPYVLEVFQKSGVQRPITVISQGYPERHRTKPIEKKSDLLKLGILGVPTCRKNFEQLLEAVSQLHQKDYNVELNIHCPWLVHHTQRAWGELPGITLSEGKLSDQEINLWYSQLDAYIYPSSGEGWSFTPRESMSLGIPTIISDIPVHQELVESGYYLPIQSNTWEPAYYEFLKSDCGEWKQYSVEQIQDAIVELVNNYNYWYSQAQQGKHWVADRHTWQPIEKQLLSEVFPKHILFCPTKDQACGIHTYSQDLIKALPDTKYVGSYSHIQELMLRESIRSIHIQHEFGIVNTSELLSNVKHWQCRKQITLHSVIRGYKDPLFSELLHCFDDIFVLTQDAQSEILNAKYVPHGTELALPESPSAKNEPPIVASFGFVHEKKGYSYILEATRHLNLRWRIVGQLKKELEERVKVWQQHIQSQAHVEHVDRFLSEPQVFRLLSEASVLIFYYQDDDYLYQSGAVLKAARCQRPIICSAATPLKQLQGCVHFVPYGDAEALSSGIQLILENPTYAQSLVKAMNQYLSDNQWEFVAARMLTK